MKIILPNVWDGKKYKLVLDEQNWGADKSWDASCIGNFLMELGHLIRCQENVTVEIKDGEMNVR